MERILGFVLLFAGLGVIGASLFFSFQIFTAKIPPPQIFSVLEQQAPATGTGLEGQLQGILGEQLKTFIPANTVPKALNLSIWSLFAGLLFWGGGQIASIGIRLLKA